MGRLLRLPYLKRMVSMNALRKGLLGGSPLWRAVWVFMTIRRMWSKVSKKGEAPVTFTEPIPEGEAWTLVHVPEKSRRGDGKGRRLVVGPKRTQPRVTRVVGPIVAEIARSALAAPPIQDEVIEVPKLGRKDAKRAKRQTKVDAKQAKTDTKHAKRQTKVDAKQAKTDTKHANRQTKVDAKQAVREAKRASRHVETAPVQDLAHDQ